MRGRRERVAGAAAALLAGLAMALAAGAEARPDARFDTVVIDAGHGGDDDGARGAGGLLEKELALDVSRRLARQLRKAGLRVVLTREQDRFVPLEQRTAIANDAQADLFVSVHGNAAPEADARGTETFFLALDASDASAQAVASRENSAFGPVGPGAAVVADPLIALMGDLIATKHLEESSEFARLAQARLAGLDPHHSRGVKQAPFVVLMGIQMPAALVEIGFVTNERDATRLASAAGRERISEALAAAVIDFGRRYERRRGGP